MEDIFKYKDQNLSHRVAVNAYLITGDKFLILKRALPPYLWSPPGGKLRVYEDPVVGLKREVREETNLEVEVHDPVTTWFGNFNEIMLLSIDYLCTLKKGTITLSHEHSSYRWLSIVELEHGQETYFNSPFGFKLSDFILAWRLYLMREKRYQELIKFNGI
jgi:ADP-ribose pyrophosphatase YjhB (NUDIX family)